MKLLNAIFPFEFLTDCFSGTAEGKLATHSELRVPPIRGHVRMWHVAAFGINSCNEVWGSTAGDGAGSRVAMKLTELPQASAAGSDVLPHKDNERHRGSRPALSAGSRATLELTCLPLCDQAQWDKAQQAVKLWLLLGTLGLRSARAAGSVWPIEDPVKPWVPNDAATLKKTLTALGLGRQSVALIGEGKGSTARDLRTTASDTVNERTVFGGINDRAPSPTRFKVISLGTGQCLLANAAQNVPSTLTRAESLLCRKPQPARWVALGAWNHLLP